MGKNVGRPRPGQTLIVYEAGQRSRSVGGRGRKDVIESRELLAKKILRVEIVQKF